MPPTGYPVDRHLNDTGRHHDHRRDHDSRRDHRHRVCDGRGGIAEHRRRERNQVLGSEYDRVVEQEGGPPGSGARDSGAGSGRTTN